MDEDEEMEDAELVETITEGQERPNFATISQVPVTPGDVANGGFHTLDDFVLFGAEAAQACHNMQVRLPVPHGTMDILTLHKVGDVSSGLQFIAML